MLATLCSAFEYKPLEEVDLNDNALGEKGRRARMPILASLETLRQLLLNNTGASSECAKVLADLLLGEAAATKLQRLHFCNNRYPESSDV